MFTRTSVFLILLLNLSHYITCDEVEDDLMQQISTLSNMMGPCSEYFQYKLSDDHIYGKLTMPHMELGDTVKIEFLVNQTTGYSTNIFLPDGTSQEVIKRLQKKQPISYYVSFPAMNDVPELVEILINDTELCKGELRIRGHQIVYTLQHTLIIRNGSMQVFTHNIYMPHFDEAKNESCGHVDEGFSFNGAIPLVFGGTLISRGDYPWLTAIYKKHSTGISFLCGGSLVTSKIILSAAHCFVELSFAPEKITTILGKYNLTNLMEEDCATRDIERIILHPDFKYRQGFSDADMALLVMKEHVSFTKFIKPICLWSEPADGSVIVNQTGVTVGWGRDENGNRISVAPKKVNMNIVSDADCLRSSIAFSAMTSSRTLCAGNRDGSGPCKGDSGGALMVNRNGTWMIRGVTSVGLTKDELCNLHEYTVFCDVAKHMTWLQNNIRQQQPLVTASFDDICGISSSESRFEHPWIVAVYQHFRTGELFLCAGSIVSSRSVVLPYGCFERGLLHFSRLRVYPGRYDISNMNEKGTVSRKVESLIFLSENSNNTIVAGNVALIQMKDPVSFSQYIKPICLWSAPRYESQSMEQNSTISGWVFLDVMNEISMVRTSIEINSPVEYCHLRMGPTLCIQLGNGTFKDQSGPRIRMIKRNERWLLLGACTYYNSKSKNGIQCGLDYNDMAATMSWIRKNMLS